MSIEKINENNGFYLADDVDNLLDLLEILLKEKETEISKDKLDYLLTVQPKQKKEPKAWVASLIRMGYEEGVKDTVKDLATCLEKLE
jgi:DNA-binding SARP family transcriptional activator